MNNLLNNINLAKFRFWFIAQKKINTLENMPLLRGKIGFLFKQKVCKHQNFKTALCIDCIEKKECLYTNLFSPDIINKNLIKPYIISVESFDNVNDINYGDRGWIYLTLFGPAVKFFNLFLEIFYFAIESLPIYSDQLELMIPELCCNSNNNNNENIDKIYKNNKNKLVYYDLNDWISQFINNYNTKTKDIKIIFKSPIRLKKNKSFVLNNLSFLILIQTIIRRLRDLKRSYGNDKDMGKLENILKEAKTISIRENHLFWYRHKRYSFSQKKNVFLDGFCGNIHYIGNIDPFIPLLKAGELLHIGKGTTCGNGKYIF